MRVESARVGARGTDSVTLVSASQALALKAHGVDFCFQYLGSATPENLQGILAAGLAFMPVTYADRFNGQEAVDELTKLGVPKGCTVWLDLEGLVPYQHPYETLKAARSWANELVSAGYQPGLYVGSPQPFTSAELYALPFVRYWRAPSRIVDRQGNPAEPARGWCCFQLWPSVWWPDDSHPDRVWVDVDFVQNDYRGDAPSWVVA